MLEDELKFDADDAFAIPPLPGLTPKPPKTLTATYYDTDDLRLARAGASLRHRVGDELPWTVKLPTDTPGVRHEISRMGKPGRPPAVLVWLVASLTLGAPLRAVTVLRTERTRYDLLDAEGRALAEIADDRVTAGETAFREIEIEYLRGTRKELSFVERELVGAGARLGLHPSKVVRALGHRAQSPPKRVLPKKVSKNASAAETVCAAVRSGVHRVMQHDPLVRLGEPLPDGDTAVHQMRVGCRRLRSDLRTFRDVLDPEWTRKLRSELGWLAELLGAARDAEVLRDRLAATATSDPLAPMPASDLRRIDAQLASRQAQALSALRAGMRTNRYLALLESLTEATRSIPLTRRARRPLVLPLAGKLLINGCRLTADAPDGQWHEVRILAKRARYAAEAVGGRRNRLAKSLAELQELLGEHQDAAVAAEVWLSFAAESDLAVTAGRLYERERAAIRRVRADFPALWESIRFPTQQVE